MQIDLTGRTALVTGSTSGIGFAIAEGLLAAGSRVVINGRSAERVEAARRRLGAEDRVTGVVADAGTAEGCSLLVESVPTVDILINNVGVFTPRPLLEISDTEWEQMFAVNVLSGVRLSRSYLRQMMDRHWGRIVFLSSESALQVPVEMVHYGASKIAQLAVARGFAEASAGSGVTVNSVLPGPTLSEGVEKFVHELMGSEGDAADRFMQTHRPSSLLRRLATPQEVANLVVYLSSPQASATTGAALRVDGGLIRSVV